MRRAIHLLFAGAAVAALTAVSAAQAQSAAETHSAGMTAADHGKALMLHHEHHHRDMAQHLRDILQLRPAQEAALTAYVAATEPPHGTMTPTGESAPKTTPERLALEEKMLIEHAAAMRERIAATRRFYDQLDPAQKKAFDELHGGMHLGLFHMAGLPMEDMAFMAMPPMPPLPPIAPMPPEPPPAPDGF